MTSIQQKATPNANGNLFEVKTVQSGAFRTLARPSINPTGGYRARRSSRKIRCSKRHKHTRRCLKRGTRKGGFFPPVSALGSFMQSGPGLVVPAGVAGYHMLRNYKGPTKNRTRNN
jgi:hypothetical protein